MKNQRYDLVPFIILFILFNNFFLFGKNLLATYGMDYQVMIIANSLFFIISLMAYLMQKKALKNTNPNVFIRSVMGGMMLKMLICVIAVAIYVIAFKDNFSKASIFASMFLYLIYLGIEVKVASKLNKQKNG